MMCNALCHEFSALVGAIGTSAMAGAICGLGAPRWRLLPRARTATYSRGPGAWRARPPNCARVGTVGRRWGTTV